MRAQIFRRRLRALLVTGLLAAAVPIVASAVQGDEGSSAFRDKAGFYPEFAGRELGFIEGELGRPVNVVVQFGDWRPGALSSSTWGEVTDAGKLQTRSSTADLVLSVPLAFTNDYVTADTAGGRAKIAGLLDEVSSGRWDGEYRTSARLMIAAGYGDAILRLGWEMNGAWFPWSAVGNESRYVAAFRHVAQVFRSESNAFRFDWAPMHTGPQRSSWDSGTVGAYPGDDVVDFIGLSVYDKGPTGVWNGSTRTWNDPAAVWRSYFLPGLEVQKEFAVKHGKKLSYPEWGLAGGGTEAPQAAGGDNPNFIQSMADWMNALPGSGGGSLGYHGYFWSDPPHDGPHRMTSFPKSWALYKQLAGGSGPVPPNPVSRNISGSSVPAPAPAAPADPPASGGTGPTGSGGTTGGTTPSGPGTTTVMTNPAGVFSDTFETGTLDPRWTFVNPRNDVTVALGGGSATVTVPPGPRHDLWTGTADAPRLLQPMANADFDVEARFLSTTKRFVQYQGIVAEGSSGFIRFIVVNNGSRNLLHAASVVDGKEVQYTWTPITLDGAYSLRVRRTGDTFVAFYSSDGETWTQWVSLTLPMNAERIGPYVGTSGVDGSVPGYVSVIDQFVVRGFATTVTNPTTTPTKPSTGAIVAPTGSGTGSGSPTGVDDFDGTSLGSGWTVLNAKGDVKVSVADGAARLEIPGGAPHDLWVGTADAPVLAKAAPSGDFQLEARFTSVPGKAVQSEGLVVMDDAGNFSRFLLFNNGWSNHINTASVVGGGFDWRSTAEVPVSGPFSIRVRKAGDQLTGWWSTDGSTWNQFHSFKAPHAITKVGVYGATAGSATAAPSFTTVVDRFSMAAV
ncbi:MAG: glycosyl hydrolase [Acidimicrobiia bacterium]